MTVCTAWFALRPRRGRSYAFWLAVGKRVKERRVRHADLGRVREIIWEVEGIWIDDAPLKRRSREARRAPL